MTAIVGRAPALNWSDGKHPHALPESVPHAYTNTAPTVANAIPDQHATAGTAFNYTFPSNTFTDANNDGLTYEATKSDGAALPTWLSFSAAARKFSGTAGAADVETLASESQRDRRSRIDQ